ncbi:MAG: peptidoglycan DD-metalloendopeptidase family protein [Rhodocyclales bacterium]|nr:peptidoglycan DD-metalloendopeptidase family protein [Rhodocyclales bacterium]
MVERGEPAAEPAPIVKPSIAVPVTGEVQVQGFYTVRKGDTLYSIALEHGQDYKEVAAWNRLENANRIQVGQQLRVTPPEEETPVAVVKPVVSSAPVEAKATGINTDAFKREPKGGKEPYSEEALARLRKAEGAQAPTEKSVDKAPEKPVEMPPEKPAAAPPPPGDEAIDWAWPMPGKVVLPYTGGGAGKEINRGIDIAGKSGEPVLAAANGIITYVGSGIPGYGNFAIVRHNTSYLSVYANNSRVLVKEHQTVNKGQKIAEIGSADADQAKLHFEIRHLGKPVDPLKFLPAR